jgi:hypothetical protein
VDALDVLSMLGGVQHVLSTKRQFKGSDTMTVHALKKGTLAALMVLVMALGTMTACASTDEGGAGKCEDGKADCLDDQL